MEINDLIIFKTVVTEGSISKAANILGYVQPHLTERIKRLEQELDTPLLHRSNKGITPLPSGDVLVDYANRILNLVDEAKHEIKRTHALPYRIATSPSILSSYVSKRISGTFMKYELTIENSCQLYSLLRNQRVDMVITYGTYADSDFQQVGSHTISMGLQKAKGKTIVDYAKEYFFVSQDQQCPFRKRTIDFMEKNHIPKEQLQPLDSFSLIQEFISEGKGIAFLPIKDDQLDRVEDVEVESLSVHFYTMRESGREIPADLLP